MTLNMFFKIQWKKKPGGDTFKWKLSVRVFSFVFHYIFQTIYSELTLTFITKKSFLSPRFIHKAITLLFPDFSYFWSFTFAVWSKCKAFDPGAWIYRTGGNSFVKQQLSGLTQGPARAQEADCQQSHRIRGYNIMQKSSLFWILVNACPLPPAPFWMVTPSSMGSIRPGLPEAVIWARNRRKSEVASTWRWPHWSSPTTVLQVAVLYLACRLSSVLWVCLNLSTLSTWGRQQASCMELRGSWLAGSLSWI